MQLIKRSDCPLCASGKLRHCYTFHHFLLPSLKDYLTADEDRLQPIQVARCRDCGLVFLNPQPDSSLIASLHNNSVYGFDRGGEAGNVRYAREMAAWLRKRITGGKVLDIGCSKGYFLQVMQELGFQVDGIDVATAAVAFAREVLGLRVREGLFAPGVYPAESFDLVTMWDVIEHVPEPANFMLEIKRVLKPGGYFAFETPNVKSIFSRLMGKYWSYGPQHLLNFSAPSIQVMAQQAGLEVVELRSVYANPFNQDGLKRLGITNRDLLIKTVGQALRVFLFRNRNREPWRSWLAKRSGRAEHVRSYQESLAGVDREAVQKLFDEIKEFPTNSFLKPDRIMLGDQLRVILQK